RRAAAPLLTIICPSSLQFRASAGNVALLRLEARMRAGLSALPGVVAVTSNELLAAYPVKRIHDANTDRIGKIPYTREFFCALGAMIRRQIHMLRGAPRKVLVLDCDQTLWKGVCGEVGAAGVEIDLHRRTLQEFAVEQFKRGMLVCLVSKNNEKDV